MAISLDTRIVIPGDVFFQEVAGEAVILEVKSGKYFGLDEIGTRMWQLLSENGHLLPTYQILLNEYDVDPARLERDLIQLVHSFVEKNLMEIDDRPI
jgi:hypothetical protein